MAAKKRLNVSTPTQSEDGEKTFWTNIGSAWEGDKGISVVLNALPVNGKLFISEPQEKDEKPSNKYKK